MVIRPATPADADAIWEIFHRVVATRDTYVFSPDTERAQGVSYWFGRDVMSFVLESDGRVVGMYKLIPNRAALGSHVANASYMVHPDAAGHGFGRAMGMHSLYEARRAGYDAMQFNFVVSTNRRAVALWQSLGFRIVGTVPRAFQHGTLGLVDAYVMHRFLDDITVTFGAERNTGGAAVRPSVYAVLSASESAVDAGSRRIVLIRSRDDVLLPGGGLDPGEDHVTAVVREVAEECALSIRVTHALGDAVQFVGGGDGRPPVEKRSAFFAAHIAGTLDHHAEHEVLRLTSDDAVRAVTNQSHAWAITRWARLNT